MDASPPVDVALNSYQSQPHVQIQNHPQHHQIAQDGLWPNGPVQLTRGRQAKDPNARLVRYEVANLESFETSLRQYLDNPPEDPEHTECQFSFWIAASFLVQNTQQSSNHQPSSSSSASSLSLSSAASSSSSNTTSLQSSHHQQQHQSRPHSHAHHAHHTQAPPGYQPASANGLRPQYPAAHQSSHAYPSVPDPAIALTLPNYSPHASSNNTGGLTSPNANTNINGGNGKNASTTTSLSILEALAPTLDPKEKMRKQRAIAKCCIDAIQRIDGYRYSFHNCWNSREDNSFRFSYYCNDSLLNKDRAANGKGSKLGKRATKPVYDCKGVLSVKFSATKQSLDVHYKHVPIHKTYEERAPPPRKDSKRRKFLEENDPDALTRIANRPRPAKPPEEMEMENSNIPPKPPKKKKPRKEDEPKTVPNSIESDLRAQSLRSLLELIQVDHEPPPLPPPPAAAPQRPVEQTSNNNPKSRRNTDEQQPPQAPPQQSQQPPARPQPPPQPARKRPRNSCDVCKSKKTKCDGTRPVCQTCIDKKRQCFYSELGAPDSLGNITNGTQANTEAVPQPQPANDKPSELEIMRKKLEEAQARILQLESEKSRSSSVAQQTPQAQQQQQHRPPSRSHSQSQNKAQNQAQAQAQSTPIVQPAVQTTAPPQVQTQVQQRIQPQQIQTQQLQNSQYGHFTTQPNLATYNVNRTHAAPQAQPTHQMQDTNTAISTSPDTSNPYNRDYTYLAPQQYFAYPTNQPPQPDQWTTVRNNGLYRSQ